jgi:predicted amidohydrolase
MPDTRIACAQFEAQPGAIGDNIARMLHYAAQAKEEGCALVLYPELIVTGYLLPDRIAPLAEPIDGPSVTALREAARQLQIALAFGFAELDDTRQVRHNSQIVVDDRGEVIAVYRKIHLWDTEKRWAEPGVSMPAYRVGDLLCSSWICYDTRFPEVARMAALAEADLGLVSTAWLGPGDEWELALRARALDNSIFVAGADIISTDPQLRCAGLSVIVDPKGRVLARAQPGTEGIICADLDPSIQRQQRKRLPLLRDRRPEIYAQGAEAPG